MGSHFVYRVCSPSQAPGFTRRKQGDNCLLTLPLLLRAPSRCAAHSALTNCSDSEGLRRAEYWTHPQSLERAIIRGSTAEGIKDTGAIRTANQLIAKYVRQHDTGGL